MSAYLCEPEMIGFLAAWCHRHAESTLSRADIATMFARENARSVEHRYSHLHAKTPEDYLTESAHESDVPFDKLDACPVEQVMKWVECLDYQSCEHPGWQGSHAKVLLGRMTSAAISKLPGYRMSAWGWQG